MAEPSHGAIVKALLDRHGQTYARELKIGLARNTPFPLFRGQCASLLLSARIGSDLALSAARALSDAGWTTPRKMAQASWTDRVRVLNRSGYARFDESTSRILGETCGLLLDEYGGDLRRLRDRAERDPSRQRDLLIVFKGIGETGADIFFREVQAVWPEHHPFVDCRSRTVAAKLGLPDDTAALAKLVPRAELPRLLAALIRADLAKDTNITLDAART